MEIGICDRCGDPAAEYNNIIRHLLQLNGYQVYTNKCQVEGCGCDRAKMQLGLNPETQKELKKWKEVIKNATSH